MSVRRFTAGILSAIVMALMSAGVYSQNYPHKPIRIVTTSPGGGGDFVTRLIQPSLSVSLGQQIVVDNRNGTLGTEIVARAPSDGYTLILHGSVIWLTPYLRGDASYDPIRDLAPVILAARTPNLLVVNPSVAAHSVKELIALARSRPGALNYASITTGSSNHLGAELFKSMAGVNIVRISYKTTATAIADLISGQVQVIFATLGAMSAHVKAGRLRALAVTSAEPSVLIPGLPTIAASGLPGYEAVSIFGVFAPAGTPVAIIARLNRDITAALSLADVKEKFFSAGLETAGGSPQQLAATVKSEMSRMGKVIRDAGIRAE